MRLDQGNNDHPDVRQAFLAQQKAQRIAANQQRARERSRMHPAALAQAQQLDRDREQQALIDPGRIYHQIHQNDSRQSTSYKGPPVHPDTPPDWRIETSIPSNRSAIRHHGRGKHRNTSQ